MRTWSLSEIEQNCVKTDKGCWEWQGSKDAFGYGMVREGRKVIRTHRVTYSRTHPMENIQGLVVRHGCDNPPCCNPEHLSVGTRADNNRDRDERGRHVVLKGDAHGCATISEDEAVAIKYLFPWIPDAILSTLFGISQHIVWSIRAGRTWKHL